MIDTASYQNNNQHLHDELLKLDNLLYRQVLRLKNLHDNNRHNNNIDNTAAEEGKGLYILNEDVRKIMGTNREIPSTAKTEVKTLTKSIEKIYETISKKVENSLKKGIHLSLYRLSFLFHLTPFERDVLLICLAPELDGKYEKIYAYLQDDVTRKQPGVGLVLDLLCRSWEERVQARVFFSSQSRLFKYHLVEFYDDDSLKKTLLSRNLKLDNGIVNFLLGINMLDPRLADFSRVLKPAKDFSAVVMPDQIKERLSQLCDYHNQKENRRKLLLYFHGPGGAGKRLTAEAMCQRLELNLLVVDIPGLLHAEVDFETAVTLLFREILLYPAAVYLHRFDWLITRTQHQHYERYHHYQRIIIQVMEALSFVTFLSGEESWSLPDELQNHTFVQVNFSIPSHPQRKQLWENSLKLTHGYSISPEVDPDLLANKFKFTGGQIRSAIDSAWNNAVMRSHSHTNPGPKTNTNMNTNSHPPTPGEKPTISMDDLYSGCRSQSNHKLSQMAQKITPQYTWPDIVLPLDKLQQLKEIYNYVKFRHLVYYDWGFDRKFSLGKGLNALFSGSTGTGKTMAAEIIANHLQMDLYKIDLSSVVSKYIGETEKNLNKIFKEAETANAILLFDEADALFGKRSEVKDAHDRYANIEINYLLQKIEEHEGIVILTTNFRKNIDEAFTRRFHFIVDFPFPDQEYRLKIWQNIFPPGVPRNDDIDFDFMARKFKIAGGSIKNIALSTAFLAASDGKEVRMEHIILATKREYQKMGNLCDKSEFGKYYELVM
ncbi:MAG: AAA family ATPase [Candidatus Aminicenantes bacterium]|nr:AAA family ATPase [Candidatus Aminicenantes bacterium]NIM81282.1 AAA family ATPase [Candidatus Aminicenantes bacterium]NIN20686.1 AAA family ATPase [Candidatus Aminicenantes bacterium]NIN44462.1 AAA family ATPase [Candidatus Aminicenantes bacterium]NIN87284.1 AAA family ATPase [Candidatus Aminicenantes bacterium]